MSHNKLKLPTSITKSDAPTTDSQVSDGVKTEMLKTQRASIDAGAKVEVAKLNVATEAIRATKAFFDVVKSHNELQATRTEWAGRVTEAEISVKKALFDLEAAKESNKPRMEQLEQSREALTRLLLLFDEEMKLIANADLSEDLRKESRSYLLKLSDLIVQLKK